MAPSGVDEASESVSRRVPGGQGVTMGPVTNPMTQDEEAAAVPRQIRGLVLIPAFNEARALEAVLAEVKGATCFDVLVVDDGSVDDTAEVARRAGVAVLRHPFNLGYGAALQTGYSYAFDADYDVVVQLDADGQHDPSYVAELAGRVTGGHADVCVGSRFLVGDGYVPPFSRRVGMVLFGYIATVLTGRRVTDPTSGYQALSRRAFSFFRSDVFPTDYPDADMLILLHRAGLAAEERPVAMRASRSDSMHDGLVAPVFYVFKMFLSIAVTLLREPPSPDRLPDAS